MISDKDHDKEKHEADKRAAEKPVHAPFSTTPPNAPVAPADMMTAQESDQSGDVPGVGPVSPSEVSPGPVETIEEQGIGPRTPYPEGDPWVPPETPPVTKAKAPVKPAPHKEPAR